MDPTDPMSPGAGGSRLRDVGRTVTSEAAGHIDRLKKSERTKAVVDKTVDWTARALEDPSATADRLKEQAKRMWQEDEKVVAVRERTKEMLNNALQDEEKMQKVRRLPLPRASARRDEHARRLRSPLRGRLCPDAGETRGRSARTRGTVARSNAASIDAYRTARRDASDRRGAPVERPTDAPEIPRRYERDADAY
jgi:hypothetical protein